MLHFIFGPKLTTAQSAGSLKEHLASVETEAKLTELKLQRIDLNLIPVAKVADLNPDKGVIVTDYFLQPALLLQDANGKVTARSAVCTHLGCTVQTDLVDGKIFCPCHSSYFDAHTGAPLEGPATAPLSDEPITVRDGVIYLNKPLAKIKIGPTQADGQLP